MYCPTRQVKLDILLASPCCASDGPLSQRTKRVLNIPVRPSGQLSEYTTCTLHAHGRLQARCPIAVDCVECLQFVAALSSNIQALTNSSLAVTITNITAGANVSSVAVVTNVAFLDGQNSSVQLYASVLTGNNSAVIFGTAFPSVVVDVASVGISYASPAGELVLTCNAC